MLVLLLSTLADGGINWNETCNLQTQTVCWTYWPHVYFHSAAFEPNMSLHTDDLFIELKNQYQQKQEYEFCIKTT